MEDSWEVEVMTDLLEVINRLVVELQGVAGAKAPRDREDGAGLMVNGDGAIYT